MELKHAATQPTIGSAIALMLGLFASLVVWFFVVWSLAFVPFLAYHAHRASRDARSVVVTKPFRWVQLYAATFLPMALFAIAWDSFATKDTRSASIELHSGADVFMLIGGTALTVLVLTAINKGIPLWLPKGRRVLLQIPVRYAAVRLSLFSTLLYLSLFLTYGRGVGLASHMTVFGILIYMMFGSEEIAELGRRIALHDVEPRLAERFDEIASRHQEVRNMRDETHLKEREHEAELEKQRLDLVIASADGDITLGQQLAEIRKKKMSLNKRMNEAQLQVLEKKIQTLSKGFDILSGEITSRMGKELPERLQELEENVKNYTPGELQAHMSGLIREMNKSMQGIPESLEELRNQLLLTASELEKHTKLLGEDTQGGAPK